MTRAAKSSRENVTRYCRSVKRRVSPLIIPIFLPIATTRKTRFIVTMLRDDVRRPPSFLDIYKRYKKATGVVTEWLALNSTRRARASMTRYGLYSS
jgi:hypothetical protein